MKRQYLFGMFAIFAVASLSILSVGGGGVDDLSAAPVGGDCGADGSDLKWSYDDAIKTLTITGDGEMKDYDEGESPLWNEGMEIVEFVPGPAGTGVTRIGNCAFCDCTDLESVTIPASVKAIGYGAFKDCRKLASVTIPKGVEYIGIDAFAKCTSLGSIDIPGSVTRIDNGAFYGCKNLESITVPSGIGVIGSSILADCGKLTTLTIYRTDGSNDASRIISADWKVWGATNVKSLTVDGDLVLPDLEGAEGREVRFTSSSVSTEGGTFYGRDGSSELTGKDRAGRTFSYNAEFKKWIQTSADPSEDNGNGNAGNGNAGVYIAASIAAAALSAAALVFLLFRRP